MIIRDLHYSQKHSSAQKFGKYIHYAASCHEQRFIYLLATMQHYYSSVLKTASPFTFISPMSWRTFTHPYVVVWLASFAFITVAFKTFPARENKLARPSCNKKSQTRHRKRHSEKLVNDKKEISRYYY